MEQDEQLVWGGWSKTRDVVRAVCIHQEDLVLNEGRGFTELSQLFIPTRTEWHVGFVME